MNNVDRGNAASTSFAAEKCWLPPAVLLGLEAYCSVVIYRNTNTLPLLARGADLVMTFSITTAVPPANLDKDKPRCKGVPPRGPHQECNGVANSPRPEPK